MTPFRLSIAAVAALYVAGHALPAFAETDAQKQAEAEADAQERAKREAAAKEDAAKAPPPAIPGAVGGGNVAPPSRNAAELSPNDALFDAINRGDVAGAREALNRGAQIDAHNVLGQTPLDAAIEANRNDVTFLLLSMRGALAGGGSASRHMAFQTAAAPMTRHHVTAAHLSGSARNVQQAALSVPSAPNSGAPNPAVGFNGF